MITDTIVRRFTLLLAAGFLSWTGAGCKHSAPKISTTPPSDVQAPTAKKLTPKPAVDPRERELQAQIEMMQDQIKLLSARTEALAAFHGLRMGPKWAEKVQAARADASRPAERVRYLEATKALLARRMEALRAEMNVYRDYEASDAAIPRP